MWSTLRSLCLRHDFGSEGNESGSRWDRINSPRRLGRDGFPEGMGVSGCTGAAQQPAPTNTRRVAKKKRVFMAREVDFVSVSKGLAEMAAGAFAPLSSFRALI
jgi:hypothetical protein